VNFGADCQDCLDNSNRVDISAGSPPRPSGWEYARYIHDSMVFVFSRSQVRGNYNT